MRHIVVVPILIGFLCHVPGFVAAKAVFTEQARERMDPSPQYTRLADKRSYRHCHSVHVRTYCHTGARLPQNWPPHSATPARK